VDCPEASEGTDAEYLAWLLRKIPEVIIINFTDTIYILVVVQTALYVSNVS